MCKKQTFNYNIFPPLFLLQRDAQKILEQQGVLLKRLADSDAEKVVSKQKQLFLQNGKGERAEF